MGKRFGFIKGQSTIEYAVVIMCIVGGLIAMQAYMTRSMQGRMREASDAIGEQYAPGSTNSDLNSTYSYGGNTTVNTTDVSGLTTSITRGNFSENQASSQTESVGP